MTSAVAAAVRRVWNETPKLKGVLLEVEAETASAYVRPGQVVVLHLPGGGKMYMAIASAPGEAHALELLVGPEAVSRLHLAEGSRIEIDPPMGPGFDLGPARGRDVLVFAVGSALAPVRPLIEMITRERTAFGEVSLFVGAHSEEDFPYRDAYAEWQSAGVSINRAVSRPWVQDLFRAKPLPVTRAVAYVCGMKKMMDDVTAVLVEAGLPREEVRRNW